MSEQFTAAEEKSLTPFFTNLSESVFGLKLPQEVAGALFSRYSRSTKSLRRTFLDEFLGDPELALGELLGGMVPQSDHSAALKKARAFYEHFGFEKSPTNELHLMLLMKDIRKMLGGL